MIMQNNYISVIVPAYNAENSIYGCLTSLLKQTVQPHEIIVVDDGSTDNTWHILKEYAYRNNIVKIFQQKNSGVSEARNTALNNVSSLTTHICFVDSDDTVEPNFIKHFAENLNKSKLILQGCNLCYKEKKIKVLYDIKSNIIKQLTQRGNLGHVFDKCFDIRIINKYNIRFNTNFTFGEDEAFVLEYMQYVMDIYYVDVAEYNYLVPISQKKYTKDNNMGMYFYCLERMSKICQFMNIPLVDVYKNMFYRCSRQFFKPFNYRVNTRNEIVNYFNVYMNCTQKNHVKFSFFHFLILIIYYTGLKKTYIQFMKFIFTECNN